MKELLKRITSMMLCMSLFNIGQAQDEIPINSSTGLVSINNVIVLNGKSVQSLKQYAELFVNSYSDPMALGAYKKNKKRDIKIPLFSANKILDIDSSLIYQCQMKVFRKRGFFEDGPIDEVITFKINFFFKEGKAKYDITNFSHQYVGFNNRVSGGKFENEEPDKKSPLSSGKVKWKEIKLNAIDAAKQIAKTIEEYFTNEASKQTEF